MTHLLPLLSLLTATALAEPTRSPEQLEAFLAAHPAELAAGDPATRAQLDALCAQKDCSTSDLYWYTDLAQAEEQARLQGKPILSLRLLGRLDEELSCANSRFFRKMLYADPRISAYLREHYILHWESVRPVPKVTIDFGDGRTLTRTLTGNSIHYVLDASGRVLDAIPGLYAPEPFLAALEAGSELHHLLESQPPSQRASSLAAWHRQWAEALSAAWTADVHTRGLALTRVEDTPEAEWRQMAYLHHQGEPTLPPQVAVELEKHPSAWAAGQLAVTKAVVENPLLRQLRSVRANVAGDSLRNEEQLHRQLHLWLAAGVDYDVKSLNPTVYRSLFLSPLDDPWYGLSPEGSYPALDEP